MANLENDAVKTAAFLALGLSLLVIPMGAANQQPQWTMIEPDFWGIENPGPVSSATLGNDFVLIGDAFYSFDAETCAWVQDGPTLASNNDIGQPGRVASVPSLIVANGGTQFFDGSTFTIETTATGYATETTRYDYGGAASYWDGNTFSAVTLPWSTDAAPADYGTATELKELSFSSADGSVLLGSRTQYGNGYSRIIYHVFGVTGPGTAELIGTVEREEEGLGGDSLGYILKGINEDGTKIAAYDRNTGQNGYLSIPSLAFTSLVSIGSIQGITKAESGPEWFVDGNSVHTASGEILGFTGSGVHDAKASLGAVAFDNGGFALTTGSPLHAWVADHEACISSGGGSGSGSGSGFQAFSDDVSTFIASGSPASIVAMVAVAAGFGLPIMGVVSGTKGPWAVFREPFNATATIIAGVVVAVVLFLTN